MRNFGNQIAVVNNGFVYVGEVLKDGDYYIILKCKNVRLFGTTKGLGQLAFEGPQKETTLDDCPTVMVPENQLCHMIECSSVWKGVL